MAFANGFHQLHRLNGKKRAVLGNHDNDSIEDYASVFEKVYGARQINGIILTHIPVHPSSLYRWKLNAHGHLHAQCILNDNSTSDREDMKHLRDKRYFCCSLEQNDFKPFHWDELVQQMNNL